VGRTPDTIAAVAAALDRGAAHVAPGAAATRRAGAHSAGRDHAGGYALVTGRVTLLRGASDASATDDARARLPLSPLSAEAIASLPRPDALALLRIDVETIVPYARPALERLERARSFLLTDETGVALVAIGDGYGNLHPDVELHLGAPFLSFDLGPPGASAPEPLAAPVRAPAPEPPIVAPMVTPGVGPGVAPGAGSRRAYLRAGREGERVFVAGRPTRSPAALPASEAREAQALVAGLAGYREAPTIPLFTGESGLCHVYDEVAYRELTTWRNLPWYRKLSVLVRNR
jgi:hypothetical protein